MIIKEINSYKDLIINTLMKSPAINKCRRDFFIEVLILFLSIKGRLNFLQLSRYGEFKEQRYRQQFEKRFDFLEFNKTLILSQEETTYCIAFDPSYINKSGKSTPGVGYFWSGCAGKAKWGVEIAGIAAIDINNHTAFHLEAVQTLINDDSTLTEWYANSIKARSSQLKQISNILVADAFFSKKKFADAIISVEMSLISRLRDDADLSYLFHGEQSKGKGAPRKYDGKIINTKINKKYFKLIEKNDNSDIYCAKVYSKSLKRIIKLVHVTYRNKKGKERTKLYFSTDLEIKALDILNYYKARFQIEFLYRDAKQYTGLNDSQARSENKLHFHFNLSLTGVNIAKIEHWLKKPKEKRGPFSMCSIKTMNNNILQLKRFIDTFGINPYATKNKEKIRQLIDYGVIAT